MGEGQSVFCEDPGIQIALGGHPQTFYWFAGCRLHAALYEPTNFLNRVVLRNCDKRHSPVDSPLLDHGSAPACFHDFVLSLCPLFWIRDNPPGSDEKAFGFAVPCACYFDAVDLDFSQRAIPHKQPSMEQDSTVKMNMQAPCQNRWKVAHLIATNFYGGPERQIVGHLKLLDPSQYSGMVFSFLEDAQENDFLEQAKRAGIANIGIHMASPLDLRAWLKLKRQVQSQGVHLLCVHGYKSTVMGAWIRKTSGIPTLAFSRGYTKENLKVDFYQFLDRLALEKVDGVVCVSEGQRRTIEGLGVSPRRAWVVHNAVCTRDVGLDTQQIRSRVLRKFDFPSDVVLCVTAGRLSPEKGHADLLQAIALIGKHAEECRFLICGDGPCRKQLERQAIELNIADRARFIGFREDIEDIYRAMDLLILPSHSEGLPNVLLEAFSFGKTAVATSVGGVPELMEHGRNGLLVAPGKPEFLAGAVIQCVKNQSQRESMGSAARQTVQSRFSFEEQTRRLEAIYAQLLAPEARIA